MEVTEVVQDNVMEVSNVVAIKKGRGKRTGRKKSPKTNQKVKKERDENAPKPAAKSFNLFFKDKKEELKAANPGSKLNKLQGLAKSLWKLLSSEDKAPYDAQREVDRERADKERAEYVKTLPKVVPPVALETSGAKPKQKSEKAPRIKAPKAPKGPTSSFNLFFMDIRMTIKGNRPEWGSEDIIREAVVMWKSLTEQDRQPYEDRAKADKERAQGESEEFTGIKRKRDESEIVLSPPLSTSLDPQGLADASNGATKKVKKVRDENAPKPFTKSIDFYHDAKKDEVKTAHPDMGKQKLLKETRTMWNALSDEEKAPYVEQNRIDHERYSKEMTEYDASKMAI
mmetsp:Transcript_26036/g.24880  ORF Transcript_26036/g.24880 Transcript_26036/m.24880 type:complete len:341 (+) Transcript_26036:95-1117(+)|eukprot:CAMPEP_0119042218 /NCGR_PEP_ID=MMETSP1177-20130426/14459_1 /TAXON_ID=2985 /ORGANISM="Ochromonas sp, Strain CCMP1899" /LENGTH=340 /DNA_ID=CAMNT_0007008841 /DNA_START=73 /DNA_END=1095 /DNA_ORIENTATION=-